LDFKTCKHIKVIAIIKSFNGRFRQNSHLLTRIQYNEMSF